MPIQVKGWKAGIGDFKFVVPVKLYKFSPEALVILPKSTRARKREINYAIKQALVSSEGRVNYKKGIERASFEQKTCSLSRVHEMFYENNIIYFFGQLQKIDFFYGTKCIEKFFKRNIPKLLPEIKLKEKDMRIVTGTTRNGVDFLSKVIFRLRKGKDTQPYLASYVNGGREGSSQPLMDVLNTKLGLNLRFDKDWRG